VTFLCGKSGAKEGFFVTSFLRMTALVFEIAAWLNGPPEGGRYRTFLCVKSAVIATAFSRSTTRITGCSIP
jgi:hypothetical protein